MCLWKLLFKKINIFQMKPETKIENGFVKLIKQSKYKALVLKLVLFSQMGWPDRTIFCNGRIFLVEFKTPDPNSTTSPQQKYWIRKLKKVGFKVHVCTSKKEAFKLFCKEMERS